MTSRMVGSVLTLVILLFSVVGAAAQTYTQMQWGMNKGVTPYAFGANINGTWRDLGTVSSTGIWTLSYNGGIQSPTNFPLSIIFTGSGTSATAFLNQSGAASSATLPEIGGQFTMTSNVGNANAGTAYKIALTSSVVSQAGSADIYGINTIAAGHNTHRIIGNESDVNINGGAAGTYGSATGAYAFVASTGGLSPLTAGYWAVAYNAGSINDGFAATNNIVRANFYAGAPAQYGLLLSGTQTGAQILGIGFNVTPTGALNTISANVSTAANGYYLNNKQALSDDGTFVVIKNHDALAQAITLADLFSYYSANNHIFRNTATSTNYLTLSSSSATFNLPVQINEAVPTISACGTTPPVATAGSSNNAGQFTLGTGTPTACTVTFANAYANYAYCTVTPASNYTGTYYLSAQSRTAFTVTLGTGTSSAVFNYTCFGN